MKSNGPLNILLLNPGKTPRNPSEIGCFSDVWSFYLTNELRKHVGLSIESIPSNLQDEKLASWFEDLDVSGYDAVIALGLRYFSNIDRTIVENLRAKIYPGFLCQIHDGSRLDNDPVDITFTLKNEDDKYHFNSEANRYVRHRSYNAYIGWAADPELNHPMQDSNDLRILVDHTNYGNNPIDYTSELLRQIKTLVESRIWSDRFKSISIRRFDSKQIVDVDFSNINNIKPYDRSPMPFTEVCKEHCRAHIFCVTHPESVGLVVLETAMAGAFIVSPAGFIPRDRLNTVRHLEWDKTIPWHRVLEKIDIAQSRKMATVNSWEAVAKRIRAEIWLRRNIRRQS